MIEALINALRAAEITVDGRDLADALWLISHAPEGAPRADSPAGPPPAESAATVELAGRLDIARALRPLKQRRREHRVGPLDAVPTDEGVIESFLTTGEWSRAFVPGTTPWFEEAVVVMDDGPTMIVWRETVTAFTRALLQTGAFGSVSRWTLEYESGPPVLFDHARIAYPIGQFADYAARRLIFLVSDCVSEIWRDQATAWDVLERWGRFGPVVLVQPLPPELWPATSLGSGAVMLFGHQRGSPNQALRVQVPWWDHDEGAAAAGTPVVALDPAMLADWARTVMACGRVAIPGAIAPHRTDPGPKQVVPVRSAQELVGAFSAAASPQAARLVVLLSAVDVDLAIARLLLRTLISGGTQVHLAEVLAGGLLLRPARTAPDRFDFVPGVREVLHESISAADALNVWRTISARWERIGRYGEFAVALDRTAPVSSAMAAFVSDLAEKLGIRPPQPISGQPARDAAVWREQDERRDIEFRTLLLARAMGDQHDRGWWFCGRHAALATIVNWLRPGPGGTLLTVTGDPGSGKSAVLGLVATLTRAEYSEVAATLDLPAESIPPVGAVDVAIYAQHLTVDQIRDGIAAAAEVTASTVEELAAALARRPRVLTVLIDAIDESLEPAALIRNLLRPLTEHPGGVRLLVGTRRDLLPALGGRHEIIDLDSDWYADPAALAAYAERRLRGTARHYAELDDRLRDAIATAVAEQAQRSFLVARIVADTLSADPVIPDPGNAAWRRGLPKVPGDAMAKDLASRLGPDAERARNLLRPLAFVQGQGLSDRELWAALASRISGVEYTGHDLEWLLRTAGSYVIQSKGGDSSYRLHHQALAEYLADELEHRSEHPLDLRVVHAMFVQVLRRNVPGRADGSLLWAEAQPYTLSHLASHAVHADLIDDLVTDVDYLIHAEPTPLLAALNSVTAVGAQLISTVYRCSASHHRQLPPAGRRQILAIDAARFHAERLRSQLNSALDWQSRWATGGLTHPAHRATFTGHIGAVTGVACARVDGRPLAVTSGHDRTVRVWDVSTGAEHAVRTGHADWVSAVACTEIDGRPVAVSTGYDRTVRVWNLSGADECTVLTGHTDWVSAVACTRLSGAAFAVTGGRDRTVRVWDLRTGEHRTLTGHTDWVTAVACTRVGRQAVAVTAGRDRTVRVWDLRTGEQRMVLTGHTDWVGAVACAVIGHETFAVTTSYDRTVRIWDLRMGTERAELTGHTNSVGAVACAVIGHETVAVTTSYDRTIRVWDLAGRSARAVLTGHTNWVAGVACTSIDGHPVALTGGWDSTVRLWGLDAARPARHATGHTDLVIAAAVASLPDSTIVITTGRDARARIWDLRTGTQLAVLTGHTDWVSGVACGSIDGQPIAVTTGRDNKVRIWDLVTATERSVYSGHSHWVTAVGCIDVDGRPMAVTTSRDDTVQVWDPASGARYALLQGHTNPAGVACSNIDGLPVAVTVGDDRAVRVWDLRTGTRHRVLTGHTGAVGAVACAEIDGHPVAVTASSDRTVRVWDLRTGAQRGVLALRTGVISALACAEIDGDPVVVTVGHERTVRIWDLRTLRRPTVIDCPTTQSLVAIGPGGEIVLGLGNDIAVLSRRG